MEVIRQNPESPKVSLARHGNSEQEGMFVCLLWHRLYAELLIESDLALLSERIRLAGHAMFVRYLELRELRDKEDELFDLRRAVAVLCEFAEAVEIGNNVRRFAASA
jgi:hypothetical protein